MRTINIILNTKVIKELTKLLGMESLCARERNVELFLQLWDHPVSDKENGIEL